MERKCLLVGEVFITAITGTGRSHADVGSTKDSSKKTATMTILSGKGLVVVVVSVVVDFISFLSSSSSSILMREGQNRQKEGTSKDGRSDLKLYLELSINKGPERQE